MKNFRHLKRFRHSDVERCWRIRDGVRAVFRQRGLAGALLIAIWAGAYSHASAIQSDDPGDALKQTLKISAGGPYVADAGSPIRLHGEYTVAGQTKNINHLKIIGQALQSYLQTNGSYPPAALMNAKGQLTVSWRVLILPYLGEKALYDRFDLSKRWDNPVNLPLLREMPAVYRNSNANEDKAETGFAGVEGANSLFQNASTELNGGRPVNGITVTERIAVGPVGAAVHLPWTAPGDIDIGNVTRLGAPGGFSGADSAFTPILFLDGTVYLVPNNVGAGPMISWTHISTSNGICTCAPPRSLDAGLRAAWDLGSNATSSTQGFDVTFLAPQAGTYTVTLHVFDRFGGEYSTSTTVQVR